MVQSGTRCWFLQDKMDFEILIQASFEIKIFKIWLKLAVTMLDRYFSFHHFKAGFTQS